ncbi:MAG: sigma-70 family RNA polymerase sigma factor [Acidobacteria bacterium]|nr:sigma-70 family RNA polymerase sigma factor [Acidobacteriota bacterium]MCL5287813.1 sigma-70 family RNA polymerase sigma factor [Acidobacteriota bacterium]
MTDVPKAREANGANRAASSEALPVAADATARSARGPAQAAERELILRAQRGETAAYEELLHAHLQRVFAVVGGILRRSEDVEDVVQQVFIKVYVSIRQFDLRSTFSTWLYKIAVNECYDYLRKKRVRRLVYEADLSEEQVRQLEAFESGMGAAPPADASRRAEMRQLTERLLDELQEDDRHMLVLKEVEGLSVEEISAALGINVNTVKVRMFRARGRLVEIYRKRLRERRR